MFLNIIRSKNAIINAINFHKTAIRCLNYIPIQAATKITVGHKMTQTIDKNRLKALLDERKKQISKKQTSGNDLLISCSSPSFNHYYGQIYKKFTPLNLASVGWLARMSSGKYFTINARGRHQSLMDESCSFQALKINKELIDSLKPNLNVER